MRRALLVLLVAAGTLGGGAAAEAHGFGRYQGYGFGRSYGYGHHHYRGFYRTRGVGFGVTSYSCYPSFFGGHGLSYGYQVRRPVVSYSYYGSPYFGVSAGYRVTTGLAAFPRVIVSRPVYPTYPRYYGGTSIFVSPVVAYPAYYGGSTVRYVAPHRSRRVTIGVSF